MRLQVFLSHSGVCSRRKALLLVQSGKVKVNGLVVKEPSHDIDADKDMVLLEGRKVLLKQKEYVLMNKPKGVTTTKKDRFAEKTVMDFLPAKFQHLFPVGRLDKDTTGVLILTNDGDFSYRLTHPSFKVDKTYIATLDRALEEKHKKQLQAGVRLEEGITAPCKIIDLGNKQVKITIREGRKRQIRRMLALFKYIVIGLKRVSFGSLGLGDLAEGKWRDVTGDELKKLKSTIPNR